MTGITTILLTGADGQLGKSLQDTAPSGVRLIAANRKALDITAADAVRDALHKHRPDIVINAAAYTAVDRAEDESAAAQQINGDAVAELARCCSNQDCRLIQISTDFVFPGDGSTPLGPADTTDPAGVYGQSKLAGEQAALEAGGLTRVLRTSWVYSEHGHNFVKTMLRLGGERDELAVVDDQVGSPTYARNLALAVWALGERWPEPRILHYADAGACTWCEFAREIFSAAQTIGLLQHAPVVKAISTADYGAPAPRPAYSVLDTRATAELLGLQPPAWQTALGQMLSRLLPQTG